MQCNFWHARNEFVRSLEHWVAFGVMDDQTEETLAGGLAHLQALFFVTAR